MRNAFISLIGLFFISTVFISCSARYALQLSDSTHVSKNLALSDSAHVKVKDNVVAHVDSVSNVISKTFTVKDSSGNSNTISLGNGSLIFATNGSLSSVTGSAITFNGTGSSTTLLKSDNTTNYKKTISDLKSQHTVDSTDNKRLAYQLESTSVKKVDVSSTYSVSNIWAYILAGPFIVLAIGGLIVALALIGGIIFLRFFLGLFKRKAVA